MFLQFPHKVSFSTVLALFGDYHPHLEIAKDVQQAATYCTKLESRTGWSYTRGELRLPKQRTDLKNAAALARERGIRAVHEEMPEVAIRFHSGLLKHVCMTDPGKHYFPCTTKVLWGPTRSGKTRSVPDGAGRVRIDPTGMTWYDDCIDREVIYLDDFYGNCRVSEFLQLTDNYSYPMRVMGGFYPRKYHTIYITSNVHPKEWYLSVPPQVRDAIIARLTITFLGESQHRSEVEAPVLPSTSDQQGVAPTTTGSHPGLGGFCM